MDWQTTPFVFPILFGTALSALLCAVGLVSLRRDGWRPSVGAFVVLSAAVVVWTAAAAVKLLSLDPAIKLFAYKFLHVGASAVPPAWLAFTVSFTGREEWLQPRLLAAVSVPPVVFVSLLFLDPGTLVIADTRVVTTGGVETLEVDSGPLHTLLGRAYNLALVLVASTVVLAELWRRGRTYLPVATTILLATLVPLVVIGLEAFEVQPVGGRGVNVVPVSAAVSAALIGVATFRYGVLDLVPLAYRTVVESTPDGLVVVDADGTVRHANRPARRLLDLDADPTGRSAATVLPAAVRGDVGGEERIDSDTESSVDDESNADSDTESSVDDETTPETRSSPAQLTTDPPTHSTTEPPTNPTTEPPTHSTTDPPTHSTTVVVGADDSDSKRRVVDVRSRPVDHRGETVGRSYVLRDVTERHAYEQSLETQNTRLQVVNQAVRHDIRNDMSLAAMALRQALRADLPETAAADVRRALEQAEHTGELTHRVADLVSVITDEHRDAIGSPAVGPVLGHVVASVREEFPDATVEVVGDLPTVSVRADGLLDSVFRNVLRNAVQHNDTAEPSVTVSTTVTEETVTVAVADDGPGIPDSVVESVLGDRPVEPDDGTGLGLYLVGTVVDSYGGEIRVEDRTPRGTVFEIALLRA